MGVPRSKHLNPCPERLRLLDALTRASDEFASAANRLAGQMGTLSQANYGNMRSVVDRARADAERARDAVLFHMSEAAEVGCPSFTSMLR